MNQDVPGAGALDYRICHYGASRLVFRGPMRSPDGPFAVCLGGSQTFGKFVPHPWPERLELLTGVQTVNLGCANAGPDAFLGDATVLGMIAEAAVTVVQVTGAQKVSNRYYAVHPRRNDRFLGPTPLMRQVFADIDFTEFHFTRHLVTALADRAPDRFPALKAELRAVWLARMRDLLAKAGGRRIVLWMADHAPDAAGADSDPWGIDASLLQALRPDCDQIVLAVASPRALARGTEGMIYGGMQSAVAQGLPGPAVHDETAAAVAEALQRLWPV